MNNSKPRSAAIWPTRSDCSGFYVRCDVDDTIVIATGIHDGLWMTRSEARLLAKRLNQCLDATVKK